MAEGVVRGFGIENVRARVIPERKRVNHEKALLLACLFSSNAARVLMTWSA